VRRLLAAAVPALALALTWGALEDPTQWADLTVVALLGLVPAVISRRLLRWSVSALALFAGLSVAFGVSASAVAPRTRGTWIGEVLEKAENGLRAFEAIALPLDPTQRPAMHALTLTAVLAFTIWASLAVAAGRPLLAALAVIVGGGWATASLPAERPLLTGALLLVAALWPLVASRPRPTSDVLVAGAVLGALTALAVGVAGAGAAPEEARLGWQSWSLFGLSRERVGVQYVWDGQYGGIDFPTRPTTVLRVHGPRRAHYWRASTLDLFTADRWIENLFPILIAAPARDLPLDPLLPANRGDTSLVEQRIEVRALDDAHLVAASQPVRVHSDAIDRVFFLSGGVMTVPRGSPRDQRYTVWSYVPTPTPRQLVRSAPRYPREAKRYLAVDRAVAPFFGAPGREAAVEKLLADGRYQAIWAYRPLWEAARDLTRNQGSPYEATLAIERWFRSTGGFRYEEHPPQTQGPPLVAFVTEHRAGYCQHYAGAMALMLRLRGIPARVAVGFTSGDWDGRAWVVSDTDAHAWVEAWFAGYGWLPFDPTPGRGSFSASYTLASDSAETARLLGRGRFLDVPVETGLPVPGSRGAQAASDRNEAGRRPSWPAVVLSLLTLPLGIVAGAKALRRRARYLTTDPRRLAGAARAEVVEVLRDQGVPVAPGAQGAALREAVERGVGVPSGAFTDALARARYGPPMAALVAAEEMRAELRVLRRAMREELGISRRLRGAISLRSLRQA